MDVLHIKQLDELFQIPNLIEKDLNLKGLELHWNSITREKEMNKRFEKTPHFRLQRMIDQLKADGDKYLAERNQLQESLAEQGLFPPVALAPFGNVSQV